MRNIRTRTVLSLVSALAISGLVAAVPASATDSGGDGNPVNCANAQPVASVPIIGGNGATIGLVEMRWSAACSGNWTRTTSYIGNQRLVSVIETSPYTRQAVGDDYATSNWSPYLRVAPSQRMCSTGSIFNSIGEQFWGQVCSN